MMTDYEMDVLQLFLIFLFVYIVLLIHYFISFLFLSTLFVYIQDPLLE